MEIQHCTPLALEGRAYPGEISEERNMKVIRTLFPGKIRIMYSFFQSRPFRETSASILIDLGRFPPPEIRKEIDNSVNFIKLLL